MLETRPPSVADTRPAGPAVPAPVERAEGVTRDVDGTEALAAEVARSARELRLGAGLSERAAARALATSQTQLRRMEDERYLPSLRSLARLAAAYGHRLKVAFEPRAPAGTSRVAAGVSRVPPGTARVAPGGSRVPPGGSRVPPGGSKAGAKAARTPGRTKAVPRRAPARPRARPRKRG